MPILCLSLLAGAYSLQFFDTLPAESLLRCCMLLALAGAWLKYLRPVAAFAAGFALLGSAAHEVLEDRLAPALQDRVLQVTVAIEDFPQTIGDSLRFVARPQSRGDLPEKIRLTWYEPGEHPRLGEHWHLQVKLRRPRGYANPAGFDYEGFLFREGIGATGYVDAAGHNYRIYGARVAPVDRLRRHIAARISSLTSPGDAAAVLLAIAVGARHQIERQQWELYAATGTSHLMAISGLHIGLAAGSAFFVCWIALAVLFRRRNVRDWAVVAAVLTATAYALISGLAVPARRALLMAVVVALFVLRRQQLRPASLLAITATGVFLTEPVSILAPGFKLSFAAVAILFLVAGHYVTAAASWRHHRPLVGAVPLKRLWIMQLALLAGLIPLTVLLFGRFTLAAPLVNLLVLPIFNFLAVPLTLAGMLLDGPMHWIGDRLLLGAYHSIRAILWIVSGAAKLEFLSQRATGMLPVTVVLLPSLAVLAPPGWPGRKLAMLALLYVMNHKPAAPPPSCVDYHALDVGQGLSIVLQTRQRTLLFDTGAAFRGGSNTAELVLLPFLQSLGVRQIDLLLVSHADLDHAGGVASVMSAMEVRRVLVGESLTGLDAAQFRCRAGDYWNWDGVRFTILHPRNASLWRGNNASCVLKVAAGKQQVLLTGDIETPVEKLLAHRDQLEPATVVFVPHHGSRTSSGDALVSATTPATAIVSSGYRNRWGLPKDEVVMRWREAGATVLDTANSGAISQRICRDGSRGPLREWRSEGAKFWTALDRAAP